MDKDIYYEKILNRIIQGRLRIRLGDLVLFVYEPSLEILEESYDIYEEAYEKAYFSGNYVKQEILELLIDSDLWNPLDEKRTDEINEEIENTKVEAFHNFFDSKRLISLKRKLLKQQAELGSLIYKKAQFDHLSCDGLASFARKIWMILKTTKNTDGTNFDFSNLSIYALLDKYNQNSIDTSEYRRIARTDPWRSMWVASTKREGIFDKVPSEYTTPQLYLCSYSTMYDNVYQSPDAPDDKIIEDDICLDGWFIAQKRKREKEKKQQAADDLLKNPKIANSQEVMLMADNQQKAKDILSLNNDYGRSVIEARNQQIDAMTKNADGPMNFKDLNDVKMDRQMNATQSGINAVRGR
ncbi:MAG: hypothetical protein CL833_12800 [Crocinitomicaceae bacterium]|nr:hypothetical protein [Crocinitomicaceae bacterium]